MRLVRAGNRGRKLRAVAYVDCASGATLREAVVQRRQSYSARTELLRPRVDKRCRWPAGLSALLCVCCRVYAPASTLKKAGGGTSRTGDINNILGVEQIDEFILGDENCDANLLNMQNVSTIIRRAGFKHWGTVCVQPILSGVLNLSAKTADVIEDSIQETMLEHVDRPLDRENADDIIGTINAYMRQLVGLGAIFGGGPGWMKN